MKLVTLILALLYGLFVLVIFPLVFIKTNDYFSFPIYSNSLIKYLGIVLIILGGLFWFYCINLFFFIGKGTPVPINPPKKIIVNGLYKFSRNPMYVSTLVILFGYLLVFGRILLLIYLFLDFLFLNLFIVLYEEPTLKRKFGKDYFNYCNKVPRWL